MIKKISVVITTHNRQLELLNCLDSLLKQTILPHEILIIDDGSQPKVILDKKYNNALNIIILRNEISLGANISRNIGINKSSGDYIAFLDDDDEFYPSKIEILNTEIINNNPDFIFHDVYIYFKDFEFGYVTTKINTKYNNILIYNYIGTTSCVTIKRSILLKYGMFDSNFKSLQDYDLWINLLSNHLNVLYINQSLTKYNFSFTKKSISKNLDSYIESYNKLYNKYSYLYKNLNFNECKIHNKKKISSLFKIIYYNNDLNVYYKYKYAIQLIQNKFSFNNITFLILPLVPVKLFIFIKYYFQLKRFKHK